MAAGSARLLRPLILRDLLVALENAEIHNERLTGQCFLDPKSQKEEAPVPQPALKLQKNCCAAKYKALRPRESVPILYVTREEWARLNAQERQRFEKATKEVKIRIAYKSAYDEPGECKYDEKTQR